MVHNVILTNKPNILLNGVDITEVTLSLTLTESLFDPVLKGNIVALNTPSTNLYQITGALGGLNEIQFSFHSTTNEEPEKEITSKDFYVYNIVPESTDAGSSLVKVTAYFAAKPLFTNNTRMVSKNYNDTISNIVKSLCKEIDIECSIEPTKGKIKRVLTYESPFGHIINLSKQAVSENNPKDVDYTFYQDIDGKYWFKPISLFKKQSVKWKYKQFLPYPEMTLDEVKYSILRHSCDSFSPIQNALQGMYSSEIISFDTTTGDYYSKTHVYNKDKYTTLSDKPILDLNDNEEFKKIAKSGVAVRRFTKQRFLHDPSEEESGQDGVGLQDDWVGNRMASMQNMDQSIVYLNVPGNSEMKVGDLIEVRKLVNESLIEESGENLKEKDVLGTGVFLITTISHDIGLKSGGPSDALSATYIMRIKAVKDSKGDEYA
jgi:hypothetical protein